MTTNNAERAARALMAVERYKGGDNSAPSEAIGDLIGDLLHLAARYKLDPIQLAANGVSHFTCETIDPPDGMSHEALVDIEVQVRPYGCGEVWREWEPQL